MELCKCKRNAALEWFLQNVSPFDTIVNILSAPQLSSEYLIGKLLTTIEVEKENIANICIVYTDFVNRLKSSNVPRVYGRIYRLSRIVLDSKFGFELF